MDDKSRRPEFLSDVKDEFCLIQDGVVASMTEKEIAIHSQSIRIPKTIILLCSTLMLLAGCSPRIYRFDVSPLTVGPNDTVNLNWVVKGAPVLLVHDVNYPASGTAGLADITLVVIQNGNTFSYTLHAADTLKLKLAARGSLKILKKQDNITDDRLRYFALVAKKGKTEMDSVKQVAVRPDDASDEIGYRPFVRGDSLVAEGINNPERWGSNFEARTVADGSSRVLDVYHCAIHTVLTPGDPPDRVFTGTPVQGYWQFRALMTDDEKHKLKPIPKMFKILITIKRNAHVPAKH